MASVRSAPRLSAVRRYSDSTLRTRAIGSGSRRRRPSTPSPSRVTRVSRARSRIRPLSMSATSRRVELVPRSTAATRAIEPMLPPPVWLGSAAVAAARTLVRRLDPILQIGLLIGLAEVYRVLRRLIPTDWPLAVSNAHHVFHLEKVLHLDWEAGVQGAFL